MEKIFTIISDNQIRKELSNSIRQRNIDQKFTYIGEGANRYYANLQNIKTQTKIEKKVFSDKQKLDYSFINKHLSKSKNNLIVSVGCGNAELDKEILHDLYKKGIGFKYIGVDISMEMLKMTKKNLTESGIKENDRNLVCADITKWETVQYLKELSNKHEKTIYMFIGYTFGNISQFHTIDIFYDLMRKEDFILFDCQIANDNSNNTLIKIFDRMLGHMSNKITVDRRYTGIDALGIPRNGGKIHLISDQDMFTKSFVFTYFFEVTEKIKVSHGGTNILLLPGEKIKLISYTFYNQEKLENFLEDHEFFLVEKQYIPVNSYDGHALYLFAK